MPEKPTLNEDEYFAREDALKKQKIALERARELAEKEREELKQRHWMRCPKCGMELQTITYRDIEIDRCFNCNGTWLDAGELEKIAEAESAPTVMGTILNLFNQGRK